LQTRLDFSIASQPDDSTCGPTCLQALYRYYGDSIELSRVIDQVEGLEGGGTLAVYMASHALGRGYRATIYTYNLNVFDPTWFSSPKVDLRQKLAAQLAAKKDPKQLAAIPAYQTFLDLGGTIRYVDLTGRFIRKLLTQGKPILTGLSATYLYRESREYGPNNIEDDVRGDPVGHFVVLCGYDKARREVLVADPLHPNPMAESHIYAVAVERVIGAILLGIVTYDANLLIVEPTAQVRSRGRKRDEPDRR